MRSIVHPCAALPWPEVDKQLIRLQWCCWAPIAFSQLLQQPDNSLLWTQALLMDEKSSFEIISCDMSISSADECWDWSGTLIAGFTAANNGYYWCFFFCVCVAMHAFIFQACGESLCSWILIRQAVGYTLPALSLRKFYKPLRSACSGRMHSVHQTNAPPSQKTAATRTPRCPQSPSKSEQRGLGDAV